MIVVMLTRLRNLYVHCTTTGMIVAIGYEADKRMQNDAMEGIDLANVRKYTVHL
jgi:hypothetical protein